MHISIIIPDNVVLLDGHKAEISNLAELLPEDGLHAVQIYEDDTVELEYSERGRGNEFSEIENFSAIIQAAKDEIERRDAPPPPLTHEQQQKAALAQLSALHSQWLIAATGDASAEERDTWGVKSLAAKAWNAGTADADQAAMLEAEATERSSSVEALVATVLAKSSAYHQLIGSARGALSAAEVAVNNATDQAGIDAALSGFQDKIAGYGSE